MPSYPSIHWIGAGLASGPGLVALANKWGQVTVWDITSDRADALQQHVAETATLNICHLDLGDEISRAEFCAALNPGDVIVSMLPTAFHVMVAQLALSENCHIVTSSYLTDDMVALDEEAKAKNLSVVNEVGLDPGIDHLLTHMLVDAARKAGVLDQGQTIDFISYCGGFPVEKTPFTYKFSWTPFGVLTALTNPAQMIKDGHEHTIARAWEEVTELSLGGEKFEAYANRNSLPYIKEYGLDNETALRTFVRGTLRLEGWKEAWKDIFHTLDNANMAEIKTLSEKLWQAHQYVDGEQDRVVLHVALTATSKSGNKWAASLSLDQSGSEWQSAMAACVSLTVAEAVGALLEDRLPPGVQSAPHVISEVRTWLHGLHQNGIKIKAENVDLAS